MKAENITEALNGIDFDLVEEAEETKQNKSMPRRTRFIVLAAAVAVIAALIAGTLIVMKTNNKPTDPTGRYKDGISVLDGESAVIYPWEYLTPTERYPRAVIDGISFETRGEQISEEHLGEFLGECEIAGYDVYTESTRAGMTEARAIKGVDSKVLIAVKLEDEWAVYRIDKVKTADTLGGFIDALGMPGTLTLTEFCAKSGWNITGWFRLRSDTAIWSALDKCKSAPLSIEDSIGAFENGRSVCFTATSEKLGIYKKALTVTESGYLCTNIMEYGYVFFIGKDAAKEIISHVTGNCTETEVEPYYRSVAGTIKEIGEGYILVDDSALCRDPADGIVYKVPTDDIRVYRALVFPKALAVGDTVVVQYIGNIDETNTVSGAILLDQAVITDDGWLVEE